jgi:hypothetical protein
MVGERAVLQLQDLRARMERGDALRMALMKGLLVMREANDPLLNAERRDYLVAIYKVIGGLESARVMLAKAVHRIEDRVDALSPSMEKQKNLDRPVDVGARIGSNGNEAEIH